MHGQNRRRDWCTESVAKAGRKSGAFACAALESHNNRFRVERKFRLEVVKFEQTPQSRPCQTGWRPRLTQVRCHAKKWRTFAAACEPFRIGSRQPFQSATGGD